MSYAKMPREEAQAMVDDLKVQKIRATEIRNRMIDEGFSFAEISEMIGEYQAPKKTTSLYGNKPRANKRKPNFSYQQPAKERDGFMLYYRAFRFGLVGIVGIFATLGAVEQGDIPMAFLGLLLSLYGFVRLKFLFED